MIFGPPASRRRRESGRPQIAPLRNDPAAPALRRGANSAEEIPMGLGRSLLLFLLGVPIPVIILLALFWR
jgi:hypothetical protein